MSKVVLNKGQVFGRLTIIKEVAKRKNGAVQYKCLCECGNKKSINGSLLKRGKTRSCGCLQKELTVKRSTKHGHFKDNKTSSTRNSWDSMRKRCYDKDHKFYSYYGGRGIKICRRWLCNQTGFENFLIDMGDKPEGKRISIDRINNDKNYTPKNCKWSTPKEQANNRRGNKIVVLNDERMTLAEASRKTGILAVTILNRINRGWPEHKWLLKPKNK